LVEYTPPTPLELEQLGIKIGECLADYDEDRMCGSTNTEAALTFIEKIKPLISSMLQEKDRPKCWDGVETLFDKGKGGDSHAFNKKVWEEQQAQIASLLSQLQQKEEEIKELKADIHFPNPHE
jgi:hypothetical protein